MSSIQIIINVAGGLALFLFGMKIMSESLQNATGDRLRVVLGKVTSNRFLGVLTGFSITSVVQSSSATTVMLVSFVGAGLLNLQQSIGIILGANIGTTVTGWIVALFGFKIKIATFALPAIAIGFFLRFLKNEDLKQWGEVLLGFGILFLGLDIMKDAFKPLKDSVEFMGMMNQFSATDFPTTLLVVCIGSFITMVIQSSSATMAMTMTFAFNGLIDFPTCCALILGENIGTTITANIAAIGASATARRCARAHTLFNVFGVIWMMALMHHVFIPFVDFIIPGDPYSLDAAAGSTVIADHMAAFHTVFNVTNTIIFLPFVNFLANVVTKLVKVTDEEAEQKKEHFRLRFISSNIISTPAINIREARLETWRMSSICVEMFDMVMSVFDMPEDKLGDLVEQIHKKEEDTDALEKEISEFLVTLSKYNISWRHSHEIAKLLHMVNELERIGDHCENLLKLSRRKYDAKLVFSDRALVEIGEISGKVREFLNLIYSNISRPMINIIPRANVLENRINELRSEFRNKHVERMRKEECNMSSSFIFVDMLTSFEKIGDHAYNIAEGISGKRIF